MPVTESRILDLIADACKRERLARGGASWTFHHCMTQEERLAFDLFLVRTSDPLAWEPGTTERRFMERVRRMVAPFLSSDAAEEHVREVMAPDEPCDACGSYACDGCDVADELFDNPSPADLDLGDKVPR